jgi:hypothetical protein
VNQIADFEKGWMAWQLGSTFRLAELRSMNRQTWRRGRRQFKKQYVDVGRDGEGRSEIMAHFLVDRPEAGR